MRLRTIVMAVALLTVALPVLGAGASEDNSTGTHAMEENSTGTPNVSIEQPRSKHPCRPASGCDRGVFYTPLDGGFHFEDDVHMEDETTLFMENGSRLLVRNDSKVVLPAETPRLFTGGTATLGTADENVLELVVDNETGLRLVPARTPNVIGGNASNAVADGVTGATIGGGGAPGAPNQVLADHSTVSGGLDNVASGSYAIVLGGQGNTASGVGSLAAGEAASALDPGSFVWSDSSGSIASTGADQFIVDASGGVGIGTDAPASALTVEGNVTPATNATHALGSPDLRWTDVWLSSVIHHSGNLTFEGTGTGATTATLSDTGNLTLPGKLSAAALEGDASNLTGVEADEIAENAVNSTAIADSEVQTVDLADASVTGAKIGEACAENQVLKVNNTGAWVCGDDVDTDTTYTAGTGLTLTGTEFANALGDSIESGEITDATIQLVDLAQNSCTDEQVIAWNGSSGAWECADTTSGDITSVSAGSGLDGGGTSGDVTLLVNTSETQARVTGVCGTDEAIDAINQDGTVSCEADDDTTYTGGTGITVTSSDTIENDLGDSIESGEITDGTIKRADLAQDGCADTEVLKWDDGATSWVCAVDEDSQTSTISWGNVTDKPAGFDDDVDNDTLAGLGCANSEIAKWDGSSWSCAVDEDTTYTAGTGLTLSGTEFANALGDSIESGEITDGTIEALDVNSSAIQERVSGTCGTDEAIDAINRDGTVSCETDDTVDAWLTGGNAGTTSSDFLGTTDATNLILKVNDTQAYAFDVSPGTPNVVGGNATNTVDAGVEGATISGGGTGDLDEDTVTGPHPNEVTDIFGTVGGGVGNQAGNGDADPDNIEFATVAGGLNNTASGDEAAIGGGRENTASGEQTTVAGGRENTVNNSIATVGGGRDNVASGASSTVAGGHRNDASGGESTVAGGKDNAASANDATVAGGENNTASDGGATVGGGRDNVASHLEATVGGGDTNEASGRESTVAGGTDNVASGDESSIGGGDSNKASHNDATVAGGVGNTASGFAATVGGGEVNTASGSDATVPGGFSNLARGSQSFAAGAGASANHSGTFVWSDSTSVAPHSFVSNGSDQFLVEAAGGVGINTNRPTEDLTIANNLSIGSASGTDKDQIAFDADSEFLLWEDTQTRFEVTDNLAIQDSILVGDTTGSSDAFSQFCNGACPSSESGAMNGAGDLFAQNDVEVGSQLHVSGINSQDGASSLRLLPADTQDFTDVVFGDEDGTTTPDIDVEIPGGGLCVDDDGSCTESTDGHVTAVQYNTGSSDVAEVYPSDEQLQAAEVVTLDEDEPGHFERTTEAGQSGPLRVVSTEPGMLLGAPSGEELADAGLDTEDDSAVQTLPGTHPIALSGRVPVQATVENGPIEVGDPLTSSSVPGVAMKASADDPVLGHAMESLTAGTGTVKAFVTPGAQEPTDGASEERLDQLEQENHELQQENEELQQENEELEQRLDELESVVEALADEHENVE